MKSKTKSPYRTALGALALGLAISAAPVASADQDSQVVAFKKTLSNVSSPELPAQAAKLVAQANANEQNSVAVAVVRAAIEKNRASTLFIVSAVAKAVPSVAPVVAATAATMEPKQAGQIAKAAAAAAPSQAAEIVFAICKERPGSYGIVAVGASEAVPAANQEILAAVSRAIPYLKPFIEKASNASLPPDDYASALVGVLQHAQNLAVGPFPVAGTTPGSSALDPQLPQGPPGGNHGNGRPPFTPGSQNGRNHRDVIVVVTPGNGANVYHKP